MVVDRHSFRVEHAQCCDSTALRRKHSVDSCDWSTSTERLREHQTVPVYLSAQYQVTATARDLPRGVRVHATPIRQILRRGEEWMPPRSCSSSLTKANTATKACTDTYSSRSTKVFCIAVSDCAVGGIYRPRKTLGENGRYEG